MKDLIFITAYCPTEEQEKLLEKCVNSVLECGKHIALISHSHIPIHIQKKCQYYVYDYNNEVSNDYNLLGYNHFYFDNQKNQKIQSMFFNKTFYGFAIYRMFSIASQIAINFGYKNIHHIEYDCELLDKSLVDVNSNYLEEYDSDVGSMSLTELQWWIDALVPCTKCLKRTPFQCPKCRVPVCLRPACRRQHRCQQDFHSHSEFADGCEW